MPVLLRIDKQLDNVYTSAFVVKISLYVRELLYEGLTCATISISTEYKESSFTVAHWVDDF